ncbi:MAG: response regulator [Planctomycetales bacterium]|nr:response regulator [Planctomycetales bacterium]
MPWERADSIGRARVAPRVLVVEDDGPLREILCRVALGVGAQVYVAGTAAGARRASRLSAAIVDVRFDGGQGRALLGQLREVDPRLPIIAIVSPEEAAGGGELASATGARLLPCPPDLRRLQDLLREVTDVPASGAAV